MVAPEQSGVKTNFTAYLNNPREDGIPVEEQLTFSHIGPLLIFDAQGNQIHDGDSITVWVTGPISGSTQVPFSVESVVPGASPESFTVSGAIWSCQEHSTPAGNEFQAGWGYDPDSQVAVSSPSVKLDIDSARDVPMPETGPLGKQQNGGLVVKNFDGNNAPGRRSCLAAGRARAVGSVVLTESNFAGGTGWVQIFTAQTGGTAINFSGPNANNVFPVNALPKDLWVQGVAASTNMADVKLTLQAKGTNGALLPGVTDWVSFTVLWVEPVTIKFSGYVSQLNNKRGAYKEWTAAGTDALGGPQKFNPDSGDPDPSMGIGYEVAGKVMPSNFFDPNTTLDFTRIMQHQDWYGLLGQTPRPPVPPGKKYPWTRDVDRSTGQCHQGCRTKVPRQATITYSILTLHDVSCSPQISATLSVSARTSENRRRSPVFPGKTTWLRPFVAP